MKSVSVFFGAVILTVALCVPARSQTAQELEQIKFAQALTYSGRCTEAVETLRELGRRYPGSMQVNVALKDALICAKEFDSALVVLQRLVQTNSDRRLRFSYYMDIASIYLRKGETKDAEQQMQAALSLEPNNPSFYEQVANVYMSAGYYTDAVKLLLESRKKFANPVIFARNLGQLYEVMRNYGDAAREYFQLLSRDTTSEVFVSGKMSQLIKLDVDEGFDTGLKQALADIVRDNPQSKDAHRYYGDYLIAQGKLDEAFQRFRLVDSLANGNGKEIVYFATIARDNGDQAMVGKACNYLLARYPQSPLRTQARFVLAQSYFDSKRYAEAESVYQQITSESQSDRDVAEALFSMGYTRLQGLHDPRRALELFERLATRHFQTAIAPLARLMTADCYLALGEAQIADSLYAAIPMKQLSQRNQEELLFKQAELQFYLGDFAAAREAYGKMMNTFPKSVYVNDCLRRIMLITEYPAMEEVMLRIYAEATYALFRFEYDSSLAALERLKYVDASTLSEVSWYGAGEIYLSLGKGSEAIAQFDSLIARNPESFYSPLAIECKGDVYAELDRDCARAKSMYETVLLQYPTSLNVEDVRKKLQRLERITCAQPEKPKS